AATAAGRGRRGAVVAWRAVPWRPDWTDAAGRGSVAATMPRGSGTAGNRPAGRGPGDGDADRAAAPPADAGRLPAADRAAGAGQPGGVRAAAGGRRRRPGARHRLLRRIGSRRARAGGLPGAAAGTG